MTKSRSFTSHELADSLTDPTAYDDVDSVTVRETHISWVFLAGKHAFKVKKPIKTSFLDYTTLARREKLCREEVRLDRRYSGDLYVGVVPIVATANGVRVEGPGEPIEYAVKMRRFSDDQLLSESLTRGEVSVADIHQLASTIADFHRDAPRVQPGKRWGTAGGVLQNAIDNLDDLIDSVSGDPKSTLHFLQRWTSSYFAEHRSKFSQRLANGFIRECHGDLHSANIVRIGDRLVPFDGIEFNDQFRWIDVLSDAAFVGMDLAARGHVKFSRSFISYYLERTGDHASPSVLRWYLVYRALVRAKVAALRSNQMGVDCGEPMHECSHLIELARHFAERQTPHLWITHGVSGSGKTTASEQLTQQTGAIRLRSDIERKRHFGVSPSARVTGTTKEMIYSESANHATYGRLRRLATGILRAGYSVVVDATFLKQTDRSRFRALAEQEEARFGILDCEADPHSLRNRVARRWRQGVDASDADLAVLEQQLKTQDPLSPLELGYATPALHLERREQI